VLCSEFSVCEQSIKGICGSSLEQPGVPVARIDPALAAAINPPARSKLSVGSPAVEVNDEFEIVALDGSRIVYVVQPTDTDESIQLKLRSALEKRVKREARDVPWSGISSGPVSRIRVVECDPSGPVGGRIVESFRVVSPATRR